MFCSRRRQNILHVSLIGYLQLNLQLLVFHVEVCGYTVEYTLGVDQPSQVSSVIKC